jgi:hypothetical protein
MAQDRRHVVGFKRVRLRNGKYLQLAVLDKPGPRGGHTVGYVRTSKSGEKVYPGHVETSRGASANRKKPKHGRRLVVKRKTSGR